MFSFLFAGYLSVCLILSLLTAFIWLIQHRDPSPTSNKQLHMQEIPSAVHVEYVYAYNAHPLETSYCPYEEVDYTPKHESGTLELPSRSCLHYKRCIHKKFKYTLWSAWKSSICLYFKDSQFFPRPCEDWLCSPEEVCEVTWTEQGTHAKRDALNTLSVHPCKKKKSAGKNSTAILHCLIQYIYLLISILGYRSFNCQELLYLKSCKFTACLHE